MAVVSRAEQAVKEQAQPQSPPTGTYEFYGTRYDARSLRKLAYDQTRFNDFLSGTREGNKRRTGIDQNVRRIIRGLSDGTITFDDINNEFLDTKQGLRNLHENPNKDEVGLAAQYVYDLMGLAEEYQDPSEKNKIKWDGQNTIDLITTRGLFNSDSAPTEEQLAAYIDRDFADPKSKKRSLTNRGRYNYNQLNPRATREWWDANITGFTDEDFNRWSPIIARASSVWNDTTGMDAGDLASLMELSPNIPWRRMGYLGEGYSDEADKAAKQAQEQAEAAALAADPIAQQRQQIQADWNTFESWMNSRYPKSKQKLGSSMSLNSKKTYGAWTDEQLQAALSKLSNDELKKMFQKYFAVKGYSIGSDSRIQKHFSDRGVVIKADSFDTQYGMSALLRAMQKDANGNDRRMLTSIGSQFPRVYHVPGLDKDLTGMVWDSISNTIRRMHFHDLPYWQDQVYAEYTNQQQTGFSNGNQYAGFQQRYFTPSAKKGGVLYAKKGDRFSTLLDAVFYTSDDLSDDNRYRNVLQSDKTVKPEKRFAVGTVNGNTDGKYVVEPGGAELEATDYYNDFVKLLTSRENLAKTWAIRYKQLNNTSQNHWGSWFNDPANEDSFNFDSFIKSTTSVGENPVWFDGLNGIGHDFYKGRVYQIKNEDGTVQDGYYDDLFDENNNEYEEIEGDIDETNPLATIHYMRRKTAGTNPQGVVDPVSGEITNPDGSPIVVGPTEQPPGGPTPGGGTPDPEDPDDTTFRPGKGDGPRQSLNLKNLKINPLLFDITEWGLRLAGNAANEKQLLEDYLTFDPEHRQSPEVWDWFSNSSGRREGAEMEQNLSTPLTSNANKVMDQKFDAQRLKTKLYTNPSYQADHNMGLKSLEKQIENDNYSAHSRWETAKLNKKTHWDITNDNNKTRATRKVADIESTANLIKKFKSYIQDKDTEEKTRRQTALADVLQSDYQQALAQLKTAYKEKHHDATESDMLNDPKFTAAVEALLRQRNYNIYTYDYDNTDPYKDYKSRSYSDIIRLALAKQGGVLIPKTKRFKNI